MPETCPVCESDVVREGEIHFCTGGMSCPAQINRSVQHFCSIDAMDIEGIGENVGKQLVENGLVESVADLYTLEKDDLIELKAFGEQSAENLLDEIETSKAVDLASFIIALGIRHVGTERARILADHFSFDELQNVSVEELQEIANIGPEVATRITSFFENESNRKVTQRVLDAGVAPKRAARVREFEGVTIVFTGRLDGFTRDEITDLMERHGAEVTMSVSSATDYLIVGENPGSTKREDGDELGVQTLDAVEFEEQFLNEIDVQVEA